MRWCRKIWLSQRGNKWRHNMAHTSCMLDKQGYMHALACRHSRAGHTHKYVVFIVFPWQQWFARAPQCYVIRTLSCYLLLLVKVHELIVVIPWPVHIMPLRRPAVVPWLHYTVLITQNYVLTMVKMKPDLDIKPYLSLKYLAISFT